MKAIATLLLAATLTACSSGPIPIATDLNPVPAATSTVNEETKPAEDDGPKCRVLCVLLILLDAVI